MVLLAGKCGKCSRKMWYVAPGEKVVASMMHDMGDGSVRHGAMATASIKSPQT